MITLMEEARLTRVTVTLDEVDVALLDRLAQLEGLNRSAELRQILAQLRPMLRATVEAFEAAMKARERFTEAAAKMTREEFEALMPEVQTLQNAYMGAMARLEGAAAAAEQDDPRPSNHGGHTPTPPTPPTPPEES